MGTFKSGQLNFKAEEGDKDQPRVVKAEQKVEEVVGDFKLPSLLVSGRDYESIKAKCGALAATDPDRAAKSKKDSRFLLNSLVRDPLSVEEEERRVIEVRVQDRIKAVQDQVKAEGFKEGYEAGAKQGYDDAFKEFKTEGAGRLVQFEALITSFEGIKLEMLKANEHFYLETVYRILKMVLLKEVATDKEYLLRLSRELIERVGVKENIRVRISPKDFETSKMLKESLEKTFGSLTNLSIESNDAISSGGCRVDTEWSAIDASIDVQLKGIYESLVGSTVPK